ncbi:MAG: metallophosphoesterase [Desulfobacteraceae bacterium]|nr:metallophosphoesterase [Desulfobacteraceae bacterium]
METRSARKISSARGGNWTRRRFLKYAFRLSVLSFIGFGFAGRNDLTTEHLTLRFPNLPKAFDGFRIVQISDLHASFWVTETYLNQVVDRVNALPKDLLVITGDLITGSVNDFWKRWFPSAGGDHVAAISAVFQRLHAGPKLAVLGNHDQWDGKKTELRLVSELERLGIDVLRNRSVKLSRGEETIAFAGTDDIWFTYDIDRALREVPREAFTVVLSHSPDVREDLGPEKRVELVLCGHTHGGQVAVPYLSHHFIPIKNPARYLAGLVREPYGYTYVNRGIGTLVFPFRIGAPPEITSIRMRRA